MKRLFRLQNQLEFIPVLLQVDFNMIRLFLLIDVLILKRNIFSPFEVEILYYWVWNHPVLWMISTQNG